MDSDKIIIQYYNYHQRYYKWFWYQPSNLSIHYGFWYPKTKSHAESLINMNKVLVKIAKIKPGDIVLDAGCGIGGSSIWIAKNLATKVIGINICKRQIDLANKFVKEEKVGHLVKFYVRDFNNTKFNNETFDVVFGLESICYAKNKKDFVSEAWRILKKIV